MQALGRYYVRYINKKYHRTGTLWEGRFKSVLVDSDNYFLTVSRYIELNPVRANMVKHPSEYPWSSFHKNALGKKIKLITPHECYLMLGKSDEERKFVYHNLFKNQIPDYTLEKIRNSINHQWIIGSELFIKQIEKQTGRQMSPFKLGGDRRSSMFKLNQLI